MSLLLPVIPNKSYPSMPSNNSNNQDAWCSSVVATISIHISSDSPVSLGGDGVSVFET